MAKRGSVVMAGCSALFADGTVRALEDSGYMVVRAQTPDYVLVASELFSPKAVLFDTEQSDADIGSFCRALLSRPKHPAIFLLLSGKAPTVKTPPGAVVLYSPLSCEELVTQLNLI